MEGVGGGGAGRGRAVEGWARSMIAKEAAETYAADLKNGTGADFNIASS